MPAERLDKADEWVVGVDEDGRIVREPRRPPPPFAPVENAILSKELCEDVLCDQITLCSNVRPRASAWGRRSRSRPREDFCS